MSSAVSSIFNQSKFSEHFSNVQKINQLNCFSVLWYNQSVKTVTKNRERFCKHALLKDDKNKIKKKRKKSRKQAKFHSNVEYKFVLKNNLEENVN